MRWAGVGMTLAALLGLVGCASGSRAREAVQAAADRLYPDEVTVLSSRGRGAAGGQRVTVALRGDPDAAFRMNVDDGRCDPGSACEDELRAAVPNAWVEGDELRALTGAFRDGGHPIVGLRSVVRNDQVAVVATVAATVDDTTLASVGAELDRCVRDWNARRGPVRVERALLELDVVDPAVAAGVPAVDPSLPTMVRLDDDGVATVLTSVSRHHATVAVVRPDLGGQAPPVVTLLRPELVFEEQKAFDAAVLTSAVRRPAPPGFDARPDLVLADATRFAGGTTGRLRVAVSLVLPASGPPVAALVFTVAPDGGTPRDFRLVPLRRDADGELVVPLEPDVGGPP